MTPNQRAKNEEIKAKIKDRLWMMLVAEITTSDGEWPDGLSDLVTSLHDLLGTGDHDSEFQEKFTAMFEDAQPQEVVAKLRLKTSDRVKILKGLSDYCLSDEAKESIKEALSE